MSTISLYLSAQHMLPPGIGKVPFIGLFCLLFAAINKNHIKIKF